MHQPMQGMILLQMLSILKDCSPVLSTYSCVLPYATDTCFHIKSWPCSTMSTPWSRVLDNFILLSQLIVLVMPYVLDPPHGTHIKLDTALVGNTLTYDRRFRRGLWVTFAGKTVDLPEIYARGNNSTGCANNEIHGVQKSECVEHHLLLVLLAL